MIRSARLLLALLVSVGSASVIVVQSAQAKTARARKADAKRAPAKEAPKPALVGTFGGWGAYVAAGRDPTCYVLSKPDQRLPANLKRDPAYLFISTRPAEHVRDEISIVMGFAVKDSGSSPSTASVGKTSFDMVAKGADLWLKDDGQSPAMLAAMKKGDKLIVKAASDRGNVTIDSYSLKGVTQALASVAKSCK